MGSEPHPAAASLPFTFTPRPAASGAAAGIVVSGVGRTAMGAVHRSMPTCPTLALVSTPRICVRPRFGTKLDGGGGEQIDESYGGVDCA